MIMAPHRAIKSFFYFLFYFTMTAGGSFSGIRIVIERDKFFSQSFVQNLSELLWATI